MSDIVQIISKLGIDSSGVFQELDKVNAKYKDTTAEVRKQNDELTELTKKEKELTEARNKSTNPSTVAAYNTEIAKTQKSIQVVTDEIVKQNSNLKSNQTTIKATGEDLKKAFDATLTRNLNGEILASRSNYIKLRTELANSIGTDQAEHLAVEMGKVKHELDLATESAAAFGSESKFKESNILLEEIGASILKMDFRGAASKAKLLADLAKTISFKDVVLAIKQIGETLSNVGSALLKNPLFLLAAALVAIVEITKDVIESNERYNKVLEDNEKEIQKVVDATRELVRANRDLGVENDLLANKINKSEADRLKNQNKFKDAFVDLAMQEYEARKKLNDDFAKAREEDGFKATKNIVESLGYETDASRGHKKGLLEIEEAYEKQREQLRINFGLNNTKIVEEEAKQELDIITKLQEDIRKIREKNQQARFDTKTIVGIQQNSALERKMAQEDIAAETKENLKKISDVKDRNTVIGLEEQKLANLKAGISAKEKRDIQAIRDENAKSLHAFYDKSIKDEANYQKNLLELQINNVELNSNGQVDSYSAKLKLTEDYYTALISLTIINSEERKLLEAQLQNELLKLDKEHQKELFALRNEALSEEERHQQVLLGLKRNGSTLQLASELSFEKARLILMEESGVATEAELKKQHNKIEELEAQLQDNLKKKRKKELVDIIGDIKTVTDAAIESANKIIQAEINKTDTLISLQQKRVDEVTKIAENGNAELLQLERDRLAKLNKEKEKFVRQQQALAVIELVANTAVTVSKAAAEGGAGAAFTIAAALLALIGGLASARSIASQAAFYDGGYTGDGNPREESSAVGKRPYKYHKAEFVHDHVTTKKFRKIFQDVHEGKIDLNQMKFESDMYKFLHASGIDTATSTRYKEMPQSMSGLSELRGEMRDIKEAIKGQSRLKVNIDKHGISMIATEYIKDRKRINTIAR